MKPGTLVFLLVALGAGGYLFWRALSDGNPFLFFFSALAFGMAIASLQRLFGRGPRQR